MAILLLLKCIFLSFLSTDTIKKMFVATFNYKFILMEHFENIMEVATNGFLNVTETVFEWAPCADYLPLVVYATILYKVYVKISEAYFFLFLNSLISLLKII